MKAKETKSCAKTFLDGSTCKYQLPLNSKHTLCRRCRSYDKSLTRRRGLWLVERHHNLNRWDSFIIEHMPKEKPRNVTRIESKPRSAEPVKPRTMPRAMSTGVFAAIRKRA